MLPSAWISNLNSGDYRKVLLNSYSGEQVCILYTDMHINQLDARILFFVSDVWHSGSKIRSHPSLADQPPIAVAPLNCIPYTGPPLDHFDTDMAEQNGVILPMKKLPAMIFLPQQTTEKEFKDILSVTKYGVAVSGSAASGQIGPLIGAHDISESDDGFLFRVALPGVQNDEKFKFDIQADGTITIKGATNTGHEKVQAHNMVFEMRTQNLCPPGDFSVSFQLGDHVDPSTLKHTLANGILEGVVNKKPRQDS